MLGGGGEGNTPSHRRWRASILAVEHYIHYEKNSNACQVKMNVYAKTARESKMGIFVLKNWGKTEEKHHLRYKRLSPYYIVKKRS